MLNVLRTTAASADHGATRFAGARVARIEDPRLLTGQGRYVDDVVLTGMVEAAFVRSPYANARLVRVDTAAAAALPGVIAVFVAADLPTVATDLLPTRAILHPPLAIDHVRYVGDPVAIVVAVDRYVAEDAVALVDVEFEPHPAVIGIEASTTSDLHVHAGASNVFGGLEGPDPAAVDAVFASAAHVVTGRFRQAAQTPSPMETRGLVVDCNPRTPDVTVHAASQSPHDVRIVCARLLDLPEHQVRVIMRDTGGGFGLKVYVLREEMAVLLAARRLSRPVKWIEDRSENLMASGKSRDEDGVAQFALDADGHILAARVDYVGDCGAYPSPHPVMATNAIGSLFPGPYRVPAATFTTRCVASNTIGRTALRGPWAFETFAREVLLDIAAREVGIDPVELRRRNVLQAGDLPHRNPCGMTYDHVSPAETFEQALEMLDYRAFRDEQAALRAQGRFVGVGTATYIEPTSPGGGLYGTEGATIRIEPTGIVNVYIAGGSTGNSIETTVVQLAADALGADLADVHTVQGDTAVTGYGAGTRGSRSASMTAGAIEVTAAMLRERIVAIAAQELEAAPADIELADSRASVRGTPSRAITLSRIAHIAYLETHKLPAGIPPGLEAAGRYAPAQPFVWSNATHLCTCEVDIATGDVNLLRYIVSEDCGPMINPNVVEGQISGGAAQGIGAVLFERMAYDADGNPTTTTFMDYALLTAAEAPHIEIGHIITPGAGPGGYKGIGEGGALGAPAAVVNAIADALAPFGARITAVPVDPELLVDQASRHHPTMEDRT